jgi:iron(III) transport system ATP-binding protein
VLALSEVCKRFGDAAAVDAVSLEVDEGECVSLLGPSGCGKSTLLRLIAGLETPDDGTVAVGGQVVAAPGVWVAPERRRVGLVFQDYALFPHLSVAENVAFGLADRTRRDRAARVAEVLELVAMSELAERFPHELSGGEQQRVALARALAPQPEVVLLDEPFSNLDRGLRERVRADTVAAIRQAGASAVFVTHDQHEALAVGDRIAVVRAGGLQQVADPQTVFHSPANRFVASFLGEAAFLPARRHGRRLLTEAGAATLPPEPAPQPETVEGQARDERADGAVAVMARPHEVAFSADSRGTATVVGTAFQGAFVRYELQLASGQRVASLQPHTATTPIGATVTVRLAHGHTPAVFPAAGA